MTAIRKKDKMAPVVSRGFRGRRAADVDPARTPPGQYVTADFPVLSAGPTPHTALDLWDFSIVGELAEPRGWTWEEFRALPSEEITRDIHCVTKWTKLDTVLARRLGRHAPGRDRDGSRVRDPVLGRRLHDQPAARGRHGRQGAGGLRLRRSTARDRRGRPARMLVLQHYFWKSAKWVRGLLLQSTDEPGFWETNGYHNYGDPWQEQRYAGD